MFYGPDSARICTYAHAELAQSWLQEGRVKRRCTGKVVRMVEFDPTYRAPRLAFIKPIPFKKNRFVSDSSQSTNVGRREVRTVHFRETA